MYLIHFNGNHSRKNGQFISGDGDNDGVVDDHHNYKRNKQDLSTTSQKPYVHPADVKDVAETVGKAVRTGGMLYLNFSKTGKIINQEGRSLLNSGGLLKAAREAGVPQLINRYKNISYIKIADMINKNR